MHQRSPPVIIRRERCSPSGMPAVEKSLSLLRLSLPRLCYQIYLVTATPRILRLSAHISHLGFLMPSVGFVKGGRSPSDIFQREPRHIKNPGPQINGRVSHIWQQHGPKRHLRSRKSHTLDVSFCGSTEGSHPSDIYAKRSEP